VSDKHYYTDEKNAQIVIALLKAHGIRKVIANPGTTNIAFVGSVQNDPWFQVYSGVDERHSAYLACGMAAESGEAVVLSCTGATASRNYLPAMTEAYYRKLPILAITFTHPFNDIGQLVPQVIDRSVSPNDVAVGKFEIRTVRSNSDARYCGNRINAAILALRARGGGPVHINIEESGVMTFRTKELPHVQKVERYSWENCETMPELPRGGKIAVFLSSGYGSDVWTPFVRSHNAIVFASEECDYSGPNRVCASLLASQKGFKNNPKYSHLKPDLIIDAGEMSGDYPGCRCLRDGAPVWRVSQDGELRDRFHRLVCLFDMPASRFVERYSGESVSAAFYQDWMDADAKLRAQIPELPFSNPWIAQVTSERIPENAVIHFGILNSLRSWNLFPIRKSVKTSCNVGGFGIDGGISTLIGASLASPDKLHFGVFGDLAFFYDLNSMGNRHIGSNLRIILVNNGCGSEFNMYFHPGSQFKEHTNDFIAAGGHFGNKSKRLVKNYVEDLGFTYLSAQNKEEYTSVIDRFFSSEQTAPIVLECFTNSEEESEAHARINSIDPFDGGGSTQGFLKSMVPGRVKNAIREFIK
jgi:2-succinyl-5-enolpyruvyl-6-hydroxy-3-cyclohexene-1-carboxylate synthase